MKVNPEQAGEADKKDGREKRGRAGGEMLLVMSHSSYANALGYRSPDK